MNRRHKLPTYLRPRSPHGAEPFYKRSPKNWGFAPEIQSNRNFEHLGLYCSVTVFLWCKHKGSWMVQLTASSVDIILTLVLAAGSPLNCRNTTGYLLSYRSFPSNLPQSSFFNFFYRCFNYHNTITTVLRPFFRNHLGEPMPEENFWTLWCKGRLTHQPSGWAPLNPN